MKEDKSMDKEIEDIEDDFEDYYEEKEDEKVEKKEAKTKATKKKKTKKKEETKAEETREADIDLNDDDLDFDDDDDSFKISGIVKFLVIFILGAVIAVGLLYITGNLGGAVECPKCEKCPTVSDLDCPEPDSSEPECPKLTSQRCNELFG